MCIYWKQQYSVNKAVNTRVFHSLHTFLFYIVKLQMDPAGVKELMTGPVNQNQPLCNKTKTENEMLN